MALKILTPDGARAAVFMHVHKTGGTWVRMVLAEMGLAGPEVGDIHTQLARVRVREPDAFYFGFVREPFDFLRSYFLHRHKHGWHEHRDLDQCCEAESLSGFLDLYLEKMPGWASNWFEKYVGDVDFVGRTESLRADLCAALDLAGVEYDKGIVDDYAPRNVTKGTAPAVVDLGEREADYRKAIRESEAKAYARWYG